MEVDQVSLADIPLARLRLYAQRMARRKASELNKQREPGRSFANYLSALE
jgi:hypothetical protein